MTGTRRAIVTPIAGTTRDALAHPVPVADGGFLLTDTGGMFGQSADPLHELVVEQGQRALATADLVVFVVDGREGLVPGDEDIAQAVRGAVPGSCVTSHAMKFASASGAYPERCAHSCASTNGRSGAVRSGFSRVSSATGAVSPSTPAMRKYGASSVGFGVPGTLGRDRP